MQIISAKAFQKILNFKGMQQVHGGSVRCITEAIVPIAMGSDSGREGLIHIKIRAG